MLSSIYILSIILVVFILTAESTYNVFTYDDGTGNDEHCCLVQLGDNFCLAKPLTRSLVQVNKECQQLSIDEKHKNYLSVVGRRLNVESSQKTGDKILIELKTPLDKEILRDDLLCLAAANNNINLEKCHVELAQEKAKKPKRKAKNETTTETEQADDENKNRRVEISEPVRVYQGHGLAVYQSFELDLADSQMNRRERDSWAWYRSNTENICSQPKKYQKHCIPFTDERVKYLQQIIDKETDDDDEQSPSIFAVAKGSKLFCEDNNKQTKLLGYYRRSEICFQTNNQVYIEHKFSDHVSLSDKNKNYDVLRFISKNAKLASEFEKDCNDKTTLADIQKSLEKEAEANDDEAGKETEPVENDNKPKA